MEKEIKDYLAKPDKTIGEHAEDLLKMAEILWDLGYVPDEHMYFLLKEACRHHDDGKANPQFALRVADKHRVFNPEKEVAHNILSVFYLNPDDYEERDDFIKIACAIFYHHDYCDEVATIREKMTLINNLLIDEYRYELCRADRSKICGKAILHPDTKILKGLLHRCDYSASGNYRVEYVNDFLLSSMDEMMRSWKKKRLESDWNDLQKFCMGNREENIIAVASTGMGKTEAGLQWIGNTKGFFILPIRTAINAIYDRVKNDILHNEKLDERLALLHSESLEYYRNHTWEEMDIITYHDRGRTLSLPLNIATLDQLFDFVFKYKGYEMKLATLAYSKVVIDEIQMYDSDLLAYLICGLHQIHELGGKIAIVTATLAPFMRELLIKDAGISFKEQRFTSDAVRHSVLVRDGTMSADDIYACYQKNNALHRGNKILVVCNTIRKAQAMYELLKDKDEDMVIHMFHSRFTQGDKKRLETEIREFGKTYSDTENQILDNRTGIWIATSLVEVSLDIDFDYLFTELSELNALFQRMGRCNRKGKKRIDEYNCFVYCVGAEIKCGKKGFVDPLFYQYSRQALQEVKGPLSEKDKMELIEKYFTTENVKNSQFLKDYRNIFEQFMTLPIGEYKVGQKLRAIFTQNIIPKSIYDANEEIITGLESRLRDIEKEMRQNKGGKICEKLMNERLDIREQLRDFVVCIPGYEYRQYTKKVWESFGTVLIDRYEKIPIMDCYYDEKGYYPLNYDDKTIEDEIMIF